MESTSDSFRLSESDSSDEKTSQQDAPSETDSAVAEERTFFLEAEASPIHNAPMGRKPEPSASFHLTEPSDEPVNTEETSSTEEGTEEASSTEKQPPGQRKPEPSASFHLTEPSDEPVNTEETSSIEEGTEDTTTVTSSMEKKMSPGHDFFRSEPSWDNSQEMPMDLNETQEQKKAQITSVGSSSHSVAVEENSFGKNYVPVGKKQGEDLNASTVSSNSESPRPRRRSDNRRRSEHTDQDEDDFETEMSQTFNNIEMMELDELNLASTFQGESMANLMSTVTSSEERASPTTRQFSLEQLRNQLASTSMRRGSRSTSPRRQSVGFAVGTTFLGAGKYQKCKLRKRCQIIRDMIKFIRFSLVEILSPATQSIEKLLQYLLVHLPGKGDRRTGMFEPRIALEILNKFLSMDASYCLEAIQFSVIDTLLRLLEGIGSVEFQHATTASSTPARRDLVSVFESQVSEAVTGAFASLETLLIQEPELAPGSFHSFDGHRRLASFLSLWPSQVEALLLKVITMMKGSTAPQQPSNVAVGFRKPSAAFPPKEFLSILADQYAQAQTAVRIACALLGSVVEYRGQLSRVLDGTVKSLQKEAQLLLISYVEPLERIVASAIDMLLGSSGESSANSIDKILSSFENRTIIDAALRILEFLSGDSTLVDDNGNKIVQVAQSKLTVKHLLALAILSKSTPQHLSQRALDILRHFPPAFSVISDALKDRAADVCKLLVDGEMGVRTSIAPATEEVSRKKLAVLKIIVKHPSCLFAEDVGSQLRMAMCICAKLSTAENVRQLCCSNVMQALLHSHTITTQEVEAMIFVTSDSTNVATLNASVKALKEISNLTDIRINGEEMAGWQLLLREADMFGVNLSNMLIGALDCFLDCHMEVHHPSMSAEVEEHGFFLTSAFIKAWSGMLLRVADVERSSVGRQLPNPTHSVPVLQTCVMQLFVHQKKVGCLNSRLELLQALIDFQSLAIQLEESFIVITDTNFMSLGDILRQCLQETDIHVALACCTLIQQRMELVHPPSRSALTHVMRCLISVLATSLATIALGTPILQTVHILLSQSAGFLLSQVRPNSHGEASGGNLVGLLPILLTLPSSMKTHFPLGYIAHLAYCLALICQDKEGGDGKMTLSSSTSSLMSNNPGVLMVFESIQMMTGKKELTDLLTRKQLETIDGFYEMLLRTQKVNQEKEEAAQKEVTKVKEEMAQLRANHAGEIVELTQRVQELEHKNDDLEKRHLEQDSTQQKEDKNRYEILQQELEAAKKANDVLEQQNREGEQKLRGQIAVLKEELETVTIEKQKVDSVGVEQHRLIETLQRKVTELGKRPDGATVADHELHKARLEEQILILNFLLKEQTRRNTIQQVHAAEYIALMQQRGKDTLVQFCSLAQEKRQGDASKRHSTMLDSLEWNEAQRRLSLAVATHEAFLHFVTEERRERQVIDEEKVEKVTELYRQQVKEAQADVKAKEQQLSEMASERKQLELMHQQKLIEIERQHHEHEAKDRAIAEERKKMHMEQASALEGEVSSLKKKILSLKNEEILPLENQVEQCEEKIRRLEAIRIEMSRKMSSCEQTISNLEESLQKATSNEMKAKKQLENRVQEIVDEKDAIIKKAKSDAEHERIRREEFERETLRKMKATHESELSQKLTAQDRKREVIEVQHAKVVHGLELEVKKANAEMAILRQELDQLRSVPQRILELQKELEEVSKELQTSKISQSALAKVNSDLETEVAILSDRLKDVNMQCSNRSHRVEELEKEIHVKGEELTTVAGQLKLAKEEHAIAVVRSITVEEQLRSEQLETKRLLAAEEFSRLGLQTVLEESKAAKEEEAPAPALLLQQAGVSNEHENIHHWSWNPSEKKNNRDENTQLVRWQPKDLIGNRKRPSSARKKLSVGDGMTEGAVYLPSQHPKDRYIFELLSRIDVLKKEVARGSGASPSKNKNDGIASSGDSPHSAKSHPSEERIHHSPDTHSISRILKQYQEALTAQKNVYENKMRLLQIALEQERKKVEEKLNDQKHHHHDGSKDSSEGGALVPAKLSKGEGHVPALVLKADDLIGSLDKPSCPCLCHKESRGARVKYRCSCKCEEETKSLPFVLSFQVNETFHYDPNQDPHLKNFFRSNEAVKCKDLNRVKAHRAHSSRPVHQDEWKKISSKQIGKMML